MKGSGDDDNHRLGEMLLFLVLLSLVLFCCLKLGATDRRDKAIYRNALYWVWNQEKTQDENATLFSIEHETTKAHIYDTVYYTEYKFD